jgi:hypothetical protein
MAARDPNYQSKPPPQVPCDWCHELLPPWGAGLHEACARAKAYHHVAICKRCGSRDPQANGDCTSHFHAVNRAKP